jgi:transcriptional regulator with XRE-family HTH domain
MTDQIVAKIRTKMLGAAIRQARVEAGKSQKEIASLIGISPSTLSSYEKGNRGISLPELELLAFATENSLPTLLGWEDRSAESKKEKINVPLLQGLRQRIIGAQLRNFRTDAELSVRELGKMTLISPSRLSAYERGERSVPIPELESITKSLDRNLDELFDQEGPIGEWNQSQILLQAVNQLSPELKSFLQNPVNEPYLKLAKHLSELPTEKIRVIAESLLEITF